MSPAGRKQLYTLCASVWFKIASQRPSGIPIRVEELKKQVPGRDLGRGSFDPIQFLDSLGNIGDGCAGHCVRDNVLQAHGDFLLCDQAFWKSALDSHCSTLTSAQATQLVPLRDFEFAFPGFNIENAFCWVVGHFDADSLVGDRHTQA